jgi:hypothetical protein
VELRELHRRLRYAFRIGDSFTVDDMTIVRDEDALCLIAGRTLYRYGCELVPYLTACDRLVAHITQGVNRADREESARCRYTGCDAPRAYLDGRLQTVCAGHYEQKNATPEPQRRRSRSNPKHGYHGVKQNKVSVRSPWAAYVALGQGRSRQIGVFATAEDAARAYDAYVIRNQINRPLNFPQEHRQAA